jgi:uncharacterized C2H2 Zn-finger protein
LTISAVSNGFTNPFMVMFVFIPVFIPALIAIYCFKKFKTKKRTQKQNIIFFLIIIIFTTCITLGIVMSIAFSRIRIGENDDIPKEIAVLELSDFGTNDIPERTKVYKQSSIFIPVNIEYYESLGRKPKYNEIMTVRTSYIQCINKKIADYVFEGFMKKEQKRLKKRVAEYQEFDSEEKAKEEKNKIREVSKSLWNIGRGYYISGNKSEIIIQKDNVIYILDSDVDFSEKEIVNICEEKFGL